MTGEPLTNILPSQEISNPPQSERQKVIDFFTNASKDVKDCAYSYNYGSGTLFKPGSKDEAHELYEFAYSSSDMWSGGSDSSQFKFGRNPESQHLETIKSLPDGVISLLGSIVDSKAIALGTEPAGFNNYRLAEKILKKIEQGNINIQTSDERTVVSIVAKGKRDDFDSLPQSFVSSSLSQPNKFDLRDIENRPYLIVK